MKILTNDIVVFFDPTCAECGTFREGEDTTVKLIDIVEELLIPICRKCGQPLKLYDQFEVIDNT